MLGRRLERVVDVAALICSILLPSVSVASPLSERLGYPPDAKVVLLHIDDIGATTGANQAAASGFEFGLAKSGSIMMPGPAVRDVMPSLVGMQTPQALDLGVHLTLNSSGGLRFKPVAGSVNTPSLVDGNGFFLKNLAKLTIMGTDADIERELESQIRAAVAMCEDAGAEPIYGECLTHIDTHMATVFLRPSWSQIYLNLALKYKLVPMIPRWGPGVQSLLGYASTPVGWFVKPILEKIERRGYLLLDDLYLLPFPRVETTYEERKAQYIKIITSLKPGVTEIIVHPTAIDTKQGHQPNDVARDIDARILRDPDIARLLRDVHLIGYRDIKRVYPWSQIK